MKSVLKKKYEKTENSENVRVSGIMCIFQKCMVMGVSEANLKSKKGILYLIFSENHEIMVKTIIF